MNIGESGTITSLCLMCAPLQSAPGRAVVSGAGGCVVKPVHRAAVHTWRWIWRAGILSCRSGGANGRAGLVAGAGAPARAAEGLVVEGQRWGSGGGGVEGEWAQVEKKWG